MVLVDGRGGPVRAHRRGMDARSRRWCGHARARADRDSAAAGSNPRRGGVRSGRRQGMAQAIPGVDVGQVIRSATKIAVPGVSRPRVRDQPPQTRSWPLGPLRLEQVDEHEAVRRPAGAPSRRACGGARRRRPRRSRRPPRRTACGPSRTGVAVRPASPGSSGNIQRVGWVIENAKRPPGRSTRAASATASSMSADELQRAEGREDDVEAVVGERQRGGRAAAPPARRTPVSSSMRRRVLELAVATGRGRPPRPPWARTQREHWPAPRADLEHVAAGDVAEHARARPR